MVSISSRRCVCLGLFFLPRSRKKSEVCSSSCIKRKGETERVKNMAQYFSNFIKGFAFSLFFILSSVLSSFTWLSLFNRFPGHVYFS